MKPVPELYVRSRGVTRSLIRSSRTWPTRRKNPIAGACEWTQPSRVQWDYRFVGSVLPSRSIYAGSGIPTDGW